MSSRVSWFTRILFCYFILLAAVADIAPRAGGAGIPVGAGGAGGRPITKPKPRPGPHSGSDDANGILSNLKRFPRARIEGDEIDDDASVFSLGSFAEDEQVLFENFDGLSLPFFSKMYDFFYAKETYLQTEDVYAEASGEQNPFPSGRNSRPTGNRLTLRETVGPKEDRRTITSTWNPAKPTDVCYAWSSLHAYCDGAGTECACSSSKYFVPAQYNSLAANCASVTTRCSDSGDGDEDDAAWCEIGRTAASYSNYCDDGSRRSVKFAARANSKAEPTSSPDDTPAPSDPDDSPPPSEPDDSPAPHNTPSAQSTPAPTAGATFDTTTTSGPDTASNAPTEPTVSVDVCTMSFVDGSESALSFISSYCQTSTPAPAGSWSCRLPSPFIASVYSVSLSIVSLMLL